MENWFDIWILYPDNSRRLYITELQKNMKTMKTITAVAALGIVQGILMFGTTTSQAITIDTVTIGNQGNGNDTTGYGGVSYIYNIGTYEVNLTQYTAFLNAVAATDTYGLYNANMGTDLAIAGIQQSGHSGNFSYSVIGSGNRPVTFVSWFDAARFANWMANGQPTGAQDGATTEDGAYTLYGATSGIGFSKNALNPNTGQTTIWWIPSEDEWYKAAYYDPTKDGSGGYWLYPTASDTMNGNTIGVADSANYWDGNYAKDQNGLPSNLSDGGAYGSNSASFYGTYDQGGNVWEWNESAFAPPGTAGSARAIRGGSWNYEISGLESSSRGDGAPSLEYYSIGFRVASVPEPSTALLVLLGGTAYWLVRRKKVTPLKA